MNIKIKAKEVTCLINDYEKVYGGLKKQFGDGREQLFSERIAGHDYLQWQLPGDGWKSLSDNDPLMANEVKRELTKRRNVIKSFFKNGKVADNVLFVPGDKFVFYKPDENGGILIRLTAWGYRYPEIVRINAAKFGAPQQNLNCTVAVQVVSEGKGVPGKSINVAGYLRETDEFGLYRVENQLPVGYEFDVTVDEQTKHVKTHSGENIISFNINLKENLLPPTPSSNIIPKETEEVHQHSTQELSPSKTPETPSEQTTGQITNSTPELSNLSLSQSPAQEPLQSPVQEPLQSSAQEQSQLVQESNQQPDQDAEHSPASSREESPIEEPKQIPMPEDIDVVEGDGISVLKIILLIFTLLALTIGTYLLGGNLIGL